MTLFNIALHLGNKNVNKLSQQEFLRFLIENE